MSNVHLSIGTATDRINLIQPSIIGVYEWEPSATPLADTFSESSLGDGRILSSYREENAIESFGLHIKGADPDALIRLTQDIRRMLIKARDYWVTTWQGEPVYLKARGACETNFRYAIVYTGQLPSDVLPWGDAFARANVMHDRTLVVERGPWANTPPGSGSCIDITAEQSYCYPYHLEFDGDDDSVSCGSDAQLDDIPSGGYIFIDGWVRASAWPGTWGTIIAKNEGTPAGWKVQIDSTNGLSATVYCDGATDAYSDSGTDEFSADNAWHYFAVAYDDTGAIATAKTAYLNVDGTWVASYPTQTAGQGAYSLDAALSVFIGSIDGTNLEFIGDIGWVRVSDSLLYIPGANYTPPERCWVPLATANTMGLWIYEGTGSTTGNAGAGTTAGTIIGATWDCDCPHTVGYPSSPVVGSTYQPGTEVGSFAKISGTGNQTLTFSTPFRPQVLFVWGTGSVVPDTRTINMSTSYGFACEGADGTLYQAAMGFADKTGLNNDTSAFGRQSNTVVVATVDQTTGNVTNEGVVSFNDDGFTINWTTSDGQNGLYGYAAFRSDNITDCMIRTWQVQAGLGAQPVTGVGFAPSALIDMGGMIFGSMPGNRNSYYAGIGITDGSNIYASGWAHVDNSGIGGVPKALQFNGSALHYMPNSAAVPSERNRFNLTSLDADGFTVNHTVNFGTAYYHHTLCLRGSKIQTGTFNAAGAGAQAVGGVLFPPDFVLFHLNNIAAGAAAFGSTVYTALGACDEALNTASCANFSDTNNPTQVDRMFGSGCISVIDPYLTVDAIASMTSLDAAGFTLNWTTWLGGWAAKPVQYLAVGIR